MGDARIVSVKRKLIRITVLPNLTLLTGNLFLGPTKLDFGDLLTPKLVFIQTVQTISFTTRWSFIKGPLRSSYVLGETPTLDAQDFDNIQSQFSVTGTSGGIGGSFWGLLNSNNFVIDRSKKEDIYLLGTAGGSSTFGATDKISVLLGFE